MTHLLWSWDRGSSIHTYCDGPLELDLAVDRFLPAEWACDYDDDAHEFVWNLPIIDLCPQCELRFLMSYE